MISYIYGNATDKWILCSIVLHFYYGSLSQTLKFDNYTTVNGLLSDEVYNLHQDRKGYLWVFTNYGVMKYNGSEFRPVLKNLPFSESFIYCIYENDKGQKWVANSKANVYQIINDSAFAIKGIEAISLKLTQESNEIAHMYVDDSLSIYAVTKHACYKFIKNGERYRPVNLSASMKNDSVACKVIKMNGKLIQLFNYKDKTMKHWFETRGRSGVLFPSVTQPGEYFFYNIPLTNWGELRTVKQDGDAIYFTQFDKLGKLLNRKMTFTNVHSMIQNFIRDKNGHTWLACVSNGIYELDEHDSIVNHYLENVTVNDLVIDSQNGLWASSAERGLFYCKNLNDLYFKENEPLANPISFIKLVEDRLFIATKKGDLYVMVDDKPVHLLQYKEFGLPINIEKHHSNYIVAFVFGIKEFHINKDNSCSMVYEAMNKVSNAYKFMGYSGDSIIFLGRKGLGTIFNYGVTRRIDFNFKASDCEVRGDNYILTGDKGIYLRGRKASGERLKSVGDFPIYYDSLVQPEFLAPSANCSMKRITRDPSDALWFGSGGSGIFILGSKDSLLHFTISEGLPSNVVYDICFTPDERVILATNKGLFISLAKRTANWSKVWNRIYDGEVKTVSLFKNRLYLSTRNGLAILNYDKIKEKTGINFNLRSVLIRSAEADTSRLKDISYNHNDIEFKFDIICFTEDKPGLHYFLSGPVIDSGYIAGSSLKLLNLAPGDYVLSAFPDTPKGRDLKITLPFNILPAWWQTTWFRIISSLMGLVIVSVSLSMALRTSRKKREKKNQAERLILEYKLIALKAQINPHFVSNCLSAIQLLIINKKVEAATNYIAKFGLLVRQILNFSTRSLVSVAEELEIASLNVELEQLRFENRFKFEIEVDPRVDTKKIYVPALILNPIIENSIWHGLLPLKDRPGKLRIEIRIEEGMLVLIVDDNGVGRQEVVEGIRNNRQSKGIQLTEQRLGNINYLYAINTATINYTDLHDSRGSRNGTRVVISLPLNLIPLTNE